MVVGLSPCDFKEAIKLSWNLYDALKNSPKEVADFAKDFAILYGVLNQIQDDLDRGDASAIASHGERRMKLLGSITADLMQTLAEVQGLVDKLRPLAASGRISENIWRKVKFVLVSRGKINGLQKSISAHISAFSLLLTSMGNSSLFRIEEGLRELRLEGTTIAIDDEESFEEAESENDPDSGGERIGRDDVAPDRSQGPPNIQPILSAMQKTPEVTIREAIVNPLEIPVGRLPSQDFIDFMQQLPSSGHSDLVEIIFSNCKAACYQFYRVHGLHRTKYGDKDGLEPKLFELPRNRFPKAPDDLSLDDWINKLIHAYGRLNASDSINESHLYSYTYSLEFFGDLPKITTLVDAWGGVRVAAVEECLVYGLALCRVLKGWDSLDRLKALWIDVHRPELPLLNKARLMPQYTQSLLRSPATNEEPQHPPKRPRASEPGDGSALSH